MKTFIVLTLVSLSVQNSFIGSKSIAQDINFSLGTAIVSNGAKKLKIDIEIADDVWERSQGLMNRSKLNDNSGMLFLFEELSNSSFWMKNTLIPLSIAFFDENGIIKDIMDMDPCKADPCQIYTPANKYIGALEVNKDFFAKNKIKVGWKITYQKKK